MTFFKEKLILIKELVLMPEILMLLLYFALSIIVGIAASKKVVSFRDFAIGKRNLPYPIIGMTLCATLIGGGSAIGIAAESYKYGIIFLLARYGEVFAYLIVAYVVAPRMDRFFGLISVGDIMAKLYGDKFGVVTGISGVLLCIGRVAAQLMALGFIVEYLLGYSQIVGILIGLSVVLIYSITGGIRAVILTDVMQFVIMFVMLPFVVKKSLIGIGGYDQIVHRIISGIDTVSLSEIIKYLTLFLYLSLHFFVPPNVQRLLICKDKNQVKKSFIMFAMGDLIFTTASGIIGIIAYTTVKNIDANLAYLSVIGDMQSWAKGLGIVGIFAIIMSTADSFLHAGSICFVNDALRLYKISDKNKLIYARTVIFVIGLAAALMAMLFKNIFEIAMYTSNFWGPIILGPAYAGILGYKLSAKQVSMSMICGATAFILWEYCGLKDITNIHTIFAGMIANFISVTFSIVFLNGAKKIEK